MAEEGLFSHGNPADRIAAIRILMNGINRFKKKIKKSKIKNQDRNRQEVKI